MREQLGREVLDIAAAAIRPGITTDEIDEIVHKETIARNAYPSPLNYRGFPKSVCTYVIGVPHRQCYASLTDSILLLDGLDQ